MLDYYTSINTRWPQQKSWKEELGFKRLVTDSGSPDKVLMNSGNGMIPLTGKEPQVSQVFKFRSLAQTARAPAELSDMCLAKKCE